MALNPQITSQGRQPIPASHPANPSRWTIKTRLMVTVALIGLIGVSAGVAYYITHRSKNPVPLSVRQSVGFPVYYPDTKKLPDGYTFVADSFSASGQAVVYRINHGQDHLVFTLQQKPSALDISNFYTAHMPLHLDFQTPSGTATLGVIGRQTVISLPTKSNTWILITAPTNMDQGQLEKVVQSIRQP